MGNAQISINFPVDSDEELEAAINDLNIPEGASVSASWQSNSLLGTIKDGALEQPKAFTAEEIKTSASASVEPVKLVDPTDVVAPSHQEADEAASAEVKEAD